MGVVLRTMGWQNIQVSIGIRPYTSMFMYIYEYVHVRVRLLSCSLIIPRELYSLLSLAENLAGFLRDHWFFFRFFRHLQHGLQHVGNMAGDMLATWGWGGPGRFPPGSLVGFLRDSCGPGFFLDKTRVQIPPNDYSQFLSYKKPCGFLAGPQVSLAGFQLLPDLAVKLAVS